MIGIIGHIVYLVFVIGLIFFVPVTTAAPSICNYDDRFGRKKMICTISVIGLLLMNANATQQPKETRRPSAKRKQRPIREIFQELGPYDLRRAYRMDENTFWKLHRKLHDNMGYRIMPPASSKKKHKNGARNNIIELAT